MQLSKDLGRCAIVEVTVLIETPGFLVHRIVRAVAVPTVNAYAPPSVYSTGKIVPLSDTY